MDQEEKQECAPPLPVLARLDFRLDRLVEYLEENRSTGDINREVELQDQCKTLSSALEEVHQKGTLMDRLGMLEKRVFQLSLEINGGNTSRSSACTIDLAGKSRLGSDSTTLTSQNDDITIVHEDKQGLPLLTGQESISVKACVGKQQEGCNGTRRTRSVKIMQRKKWLGWFRLGC
ncbi:hypothetical protein HS088_TW15G00253 [Tripterygium wilfordii]|uniref:Uncharacterized protein n=1 Tax=Tripterygium wilfordii TaxID=458696 RepID=A0A7J7CL67_TRIWF|nr:uncharacterized protein LOC119980150 [Tripterygium wilfordii]KAF5734761.1 hypothetical protein HS088_TW15G00253 [Tripterygium wilfordii]